MWYKTSCSCGDILPHHLDPSKTTFSSWSLGRRPVGISLGDATIGFKLENQADPTEISATILLESQFLEITTFALTTLSWEAQAPQGVLKLFERISPVVVFRLFCSSVPASSRSTSGGLLLENSCQATLSFAHLELL